MRSTHRYGHGKAKWIGPKMRALVGLLADTLSISVTFHLVRSLMCVKGDGYGSGYEYGDNNDDDDDNAGSGSGDSYGPMVMLADPSVSFQGRQNTIPKQTILRLRCHGLKLTTRQG